MTVPQHRAERSYRHRRGIPIGHTRRNTHNGTPLWSPAVAGCGLLSSAAALVSETGTDSHGRNSPTDRTSHGRPAQPRGPPVKQRLVSARLVGGTVVAPSRAKAVHAGHRNVKSAARRQSVTASTEAPRPLLDRTGDLQPGHRAYTESSRSWACAPAQQLHLSVADGGSMTASPHRIPDSRRGAAARTARRYSGH